MTAAGDGRAASPAADESTPLLRSKSPTQEVQDKPLPKDQLFLLCLARLVEPVAFFSIFPFVNQMIEEVGLSKLASRRRREVANLLLHLLHCSSECHLNIVASILELWNHCSHSFNSSLCLSGEDILTRYAALFTNHVELNLPLGTTRRTHAL